MANGRGSFRIAYDPASDVLYLSKRTEAAVRGIEDKFGIVWRYASNGELIGATVMDFKDIWSDNAEGFEQEIASHFELTPPQAKIIVDDAFSEIH